MSVSPSPTLSLKRTPSEDETNALFALGRDLESSPPPCGSNSSPSLLTRSLSDELPKDPNDAGDRKKVLEDSTANGSPLFPHFSNALQARRKLPFFQFQSLSDLVEYTASPSQSPHQTPSSSPKLKEMRQLNSRRIANQQLAVEFQNKQLALLNNNSKTQSKEKEQVLSHSLRTDSPSPTAQFDIHRNTVLCMNLLEEDDTKQSNIKELINTPTKKN